MHRFIIQCALFPIALLACKKQVPALSQGSWKLGEDVHYEKYSAITRTSDSVRWIVAMGADSAYGVSVILEFGEMPQAGKIYTVGGYGVPPVPDQVNIDVYATGLQWYNDVIGDHLTVGSSNGALTFTAKDVTVTLRNGWGSKSKLSMNLSH